VRKAIEPLSKALAEESPHLNLEFESNIPGQVPLIYADRIAFVRVAKNIIGNAQRYANSRLIVRAYQVPMEATDRHQASLSTPQSQTCVEFEDDGLGIPEDKWRDVIEPFVRISDPNSGVPGISSHGHSRNHSGHKNHTGIGLGPATWWLDPDWSGNIRWLHCAYVLAESCKSAADGLAIRGLRSEF
jgi:signal transduction histidine kinase